MTDPALTLTHPMDLLGDPAEPGRTEWLAAKAAEQYCNCIPLAAIETAELEALEAVIAVELRERASRPEYQSAMAKFDELMNLLKGA